MYPKKFVTESLIFRNIHRGDSIFVHTGCAEPQHLLSRLTEYLEKNPKAFFGTEVISWWTLGVAAYTDKRYQSNFRHNSFFVGNPTRDAVNSGLADYTPIFLSNIPKAIKKGLIKIDIAMIQISLPDDHGFVNLGVSVDIVKSAIENAKVIIAQMNPRMPRIHGDGFISIDSIDYILFKDEPILESEEEEERGEEYEAKIIKIGQYVSRLVQDRDTLQVGYGSIPNAVMKNLDGKADLGIHTELIGDGIVNLIKKGIVTNKYKTNNPGKSIASFCMASASTYTFLHDNPQIEFKRISYTNNPLIIATNENMTAINSALKIDLTGQATAESIGHTFYSGIGGQADFMRGSVLAKNGKSILTLKSTAQNDTYSRIVPFLDEGTGVTLNRGDIHYVVTEYGIAYIHGKNIRERAMQLISIAHPKFRPWLLKEAKKTNLIYQDQGYIAGKSGEYPEQLEHWRTTRKDLEIFIRPVKITDEPLLKDFFYSLSDQSLRTRFMSVRRHIPHSQLQEFSVINYIKEMVILAVLKDTEEKETIIGVAQYGIDDFTHSAEAAFVVRDNFQNRGVGSELLSYLTLLAKQRGLLGFTAEVMLENRGMVRVFEREFPNLTKKLEEDIFVLNMPFE